MPERIAIATFDAVGGPAKLQRAEGDRFWAGPTDAGVYRVARCARHSSPSYADWSKVLWGSEIKDEAGQIFVKHQDRWQTLKAVSPKMTREALMQRNLELYGKYELPTRWLFNDFGHMTCYFYKDRNGNGRLDKDERIHTEYFHTTPDDEAATAQGRPVTLSQSHGCIHLKPNDIDTMIEKGYFAPGNAVVVHSYEARVPHWSAEENGAKPFEVHFFPGLKKVVVTGRRPGRGIHPHGLQ